MTKKEVQSNVSSERNLRTCYQTQWKEKWTGKQCSKKDKKSKPNKEKFSVGDKVILKETTGTKRQWPETGVIKEERASDDGTYHSFIINLDKGGQCLRNKRFLKLQTSHILKLE